MQTLETEALSAGAAGPSVDWIRDWLVREVSRHLDVSPSALDLDTSLFDYGLNSVVATILAGDLGRCIGRDLAVDLLLSYSTINELANHLSSDVADRK